NVYGGKIFDNSCNMGAVNVKDGGKLNLYGGEFSNDEISVYKSGDLCFFDNATIGENIVLIDKGTIALDSEYSSETQIAVIKFEKYRLGTVCVSTELDKTVYKNLFRIYDGCYYLGDNMELSADRLELKATTALLWNREDNFIYGVEVDVNTAENISSQFVNSNVTIRDPNGDTVSATDVCGTKYRVCLCDSNGDVYDYAYILIYGDVNCDGYVDGEDAFVVNMIYYGYLFEDDFYIREASDANHDGAIDIYDYWLLEEAGIYNNSVLQKNGG
ncbi:MAG: hypothetical protein IJU39_06105, partial [Clostridia bacterium]|nr:hypothetical protein [Clostridia bacterium]